MTGAIQVLKIKVLDGSGTVKAFADIKLGAVEIKGCKIVQQDGQQAWLAMPSTKSGERWYNVVEITSKDLKQRVTDLVLAAWQAQRQEVIPPPRRGQSTWDRSRDHDLPTGPTIEHRNERRDPRQEHVDELAARFEPDEGEPFA